MDKTLSDCISVVLRVIRKSTGERVVDIKGVVPSTVTGIELRKREATLNHLEAYSAQFNIPVSTIIYAAECLQSCTSELSAMGETMYILDKLISNRGGNK